MYNKLFGIYDYKTEQPSNAPPENKLLNAGLEQSSKGNFEEAIKYYTKALQFNSVFAKAYVSRAYARSQLGQLEKAFEEEAISSYDRALNYQPDDYIALYNKACIYGLQEKVSLAANYLKQAIKSNPEYKEEAKTNKSFDSIREQPEFQELLKS
jgi:tetratricopeptide (TPR) repeat protein